MTDKSPRDIVADNLPTMAECFVGFSRINWPPRGDLLTKADAIIDALRAAGYVIEREK